MNENLKKITTGAVMIALATALSFITLFKGINGGSVTAGSMVPIILFSLMYNIKWSALVGVVYALIQMMLGFYPPPTPDFLSFVLVILLDYIIAFGILALAGPIARSISKNKKPTLLTAGIATAAVMVCRFLCHFLSGIIIWDSFAPEGVAPWLYSLGYNGGYMGPELVISVVLVCLLLPAMNKISSLRQ